MSIDSIPFPFTPYPQQEQLMQAIQETIRSSSVGVFESPTGTGKSLSIICSALHWQRQEEQRIIKELEASCAPPQVQTDDWLQNIILSYQLGDQISIKKRALDRLKGLENRIAVAKSSNPRSKKSTSSDKSAAVSDETDDFILSNYDSDEKEYSYDTDDSDDDSELDGLEFPKIYYCSRAHSQIAQFMAEIRQTSFSSVRCIALGSRKNMCIHPDVRRMSSDSAMSERCLEMQRGHVRRTCSASEGKRPRVARKKCEYRCSSAEGRFAEHALSHVRDIEDLVSLGHAVSACPYYGSRKAVKAAQVVCMPYGMMLNKSQREALGISLRGSVVIFDEAHNIIDATNSSHSGEVTINQLELARTAVESYIDRYRSVLAGKNFYYLRILSSVIRSLIKVLNKRKQAGANSLSINEGDNTENSPSVCSANDFVFEAALDNINLLKLARHASATQLVQKVGGHLDSLHSGESDTEGKGHIGALRNAFTLLTCLCNRDADGRLFIGPSRYESDVWSISFVLLNPAEHFRDIVDKSRSVILIGGTMRPFQYVTSHLFPHLPILSSNSLVPSDPATKTVRTFSCGHIVPPTNVNAIVLTHGAQGCTLNFRHVNRESSYLLKDLNDTLCRLCSTVPHGVVVFFASYGYLDHCVNFWRKNGLFQRLGRIKPVVLESRTMPAGGIWSEYSALATGSSRGACLLSVMGGKLSEGINFSDNLARCVVVVGMPYPDSKDAVLKEKLRFADLMKPGSSRDIYEAMCLKTVNQSIGRSIRHAGDYACVVLLDVRYAQQRIISQLPGWISGGISTFDDCGSSVSAISKFFDRFGLK